MKAHTTTTKLRLHEALNLLSNALSVAATAKTALSEAARNSDWAHEDECLASAAAAERTAMNDALAAYRAALAAGENDPPALAAVNELVLDHLRAERRFVSRLEARGLHQLARAYHDLSIFAKEPADDEEKKRGTG